jgi:iron complex outermembrane receptor protein
MKKTIFAGLLSLAFSNLTLAAEDINLADVIVTSSRIQESIQNIPSNIQVISRQNIQEINPTSITQVLNQLGGLTIRGSALGQFNLGGTVDIGSYGDAATSNTLVLVNGQPINPIDSSSIAWESIPIASIERIEITKGGAGVQYGNRAVGGAVNIVTNENADAINRVSASFGSFNTQTINALVQNRLDDTLIKLAANADHTNGWRDNSAVNAYAANARVTKFFGQNSVYLDLSGSHRHTQNPGGVVGLVGQGNDHQAKFNNVGSFFDGENYGSMLGGSMQLGSNALLEADLAYQSAKLTYEEPYNTMYNNYNRWRLSFSPRLKIDLNNWGNLVAGYDFSHSFGKDNQLSNAKLIDNSIYAMHRLPLIGELELDNGYRHQIQNATANDKPAYSRPTAKKSTSANAWDIGLNYKLPQGQKLYVKYNQSFRFANIDEFWSFDPNPPYDRVFNGALLRPQNDKTYQVGGDLLIGATKITASLYHTTTSNQIRYDSFNNNNINDPYNIKRRGIYLSTISHINDKLTVYINSNLQNVSYADGPNQGQSTPLAPHLSTAGRINYKADDHWSVGTILNHVSSQYYAGAQDLYNNRNGSYPITSITNFYKKIPSYTVTDVYANYKNGHWDAQVTLKNLTNSNYATYGGMGFVTQPSTSDWAYYYYPSDPRSVLITLSYNF